MWIERSKQVLEEQLMAALEEAGAFPEGPEREAMLQYLEQMLKIAKNLQEAPNQVPENIQK